MLVVVAWGTWPCSSPSRRSRDFAITGQEGKRQELRELGADEVVLSGETQPGPQGRGWRDIICRPPTQRSRLVPLLRTYERRPLDQMGVADGPIAIDPIR